MTQWLGRQRGLVITAALVLPLVWCALADRLGAHLPAATSALVLVTIVVAAAATGDRIAGIVAALSGAAWFDFFLAPPLHTFTINSANDVEIAALLVLVGLAVTEIVLWGRRQQATSSARAGYLDGVATTSQMAAGQMALDELVEHVTHELTDLLGVDACRFVDGSSRTHHRAVLESNASVTVAGRVTDVSRDGLPTMDETALYARHHDIELGRFMITASTRVVRPSLEQRRVAVLLANLVGSELASRQPHPRSA